MSLNDYRMSGRRDAQHAAKCYFDCLDALRKEWVRCVEAPKE